MDTGQKRIDFQDSSILGGCLVPFPLHFERLGVELVNLIRKRRFAHQVLRTKEGQIRKGMGNHVEYLGITWEFAHQHFYKGERLIGSVVRHGAVYAIES